MGKPATTTAPSADSLRVEGCMLRGTALPLAMPAAWRTDGEPQNRPSPSLRAWAMSLSNGRTSNDECRSAVPGHSAYFEILTSIFDILRFAVRRS